MLGFCPHTKQLVGYAHDAFDLDVIAREFKRRYTDTEAAEMAGDVETEEDKDEDDEPNKTSNNTDDDNKLQLGKHYMVFMAQSIAAEHRPFCFMVARYCLSSLTSRWVRVNKRQITSAMAFHDFIVLLDSFDGAPENRSAINQDLTLTLGDLMPELRHTSPSEAAATQQESEAPPTSPPPRWR